MEKSTWPETRSGSFRRWLQRNRCVAAIVVSLILILNGCAGGKNWQYLPETKSGERPIYVVAHGWHTGIVLSREELGPQLGFLDDYLHQGRYYEFGWGEAEFYQADKVTVGMFLKTVFWSNPSVMHVLSFSTPPETNFPGSEVIEINLSETGLEHLRDGLRAGFKFDQRAKPYPLKKGIHSQSLFFKGDRNYVITYTCNRWTANMLSKAGVPMDTVFTLRAASVMRQLREAKKSYHWSRPLERAVPR